MSANKNLPVVLITGCSSGHGEALAKLFIKNGYPTYASARNLESIEELKKLGCETLQIDVTNYDTIHKAVETIEHKHGSIGILVNNAAIGIMSAIETIPMDEVKRQYETNVFGLLAITQAVLPAMRKAGKGRIVNIGSSGGEFTTPTGGIYQATKYALTSMNDAMRAELKPFGIEVTMVQPGAIASKFGQNGKVLGYKEEGPYQELMLGVQNITSAALVKGAPGTWTPEQVAKISFKASTTKKPWARYRPDFVAKVLIYTRLWLPYRVWDKIHMSMMLKEGKKILKNKA